MGKELEGGDQESGSCTATGQMWSESPPSLQKWRGKLDGQDFGVLHTRGLQLLSRVLSHHGKGNPCPLCDIATTGGVSDGTLAGKPLQGAGASTRDRLGADTMPTCGLGH